MNYQKNLKYFESNDKHFYTGLGILGVAVILFALTVFFHVRMFRFQEVAIMVIAAAGAITAFVPLSYRSSEAEIEEAIAQKTAGYEERVIDSTGITGLIPGKLKSTVTGDYVYDAEGIILRKGKDDRKYRSTLYKSCALIFTKYGIYVAQKVFSLIEDKEVEESAQFGYDELDGVSVVDKEIGVGEGVSIKMTFLVFIENGKEALYVPIKSGATTDRFASDINHYIEEVKQSAKA